MSGVEIAAAGLDDAPELLGAYEWLFAPPGSRPPQWDPQAATERLRRAATAGDSVVLVARADGAIVGICTTYLDFESVRFGRRAWVEDLAVDPERRSLGIGKRLLDAAKDWGCERRHAPGARLRSRPHRRPPLLRARTAQLELDQLRLGALTSRRFPTASGWRAPNSRRH